MRTFRLLSIHSPLRPTILNKSRFDMGSLASPTRKLRILAQCPHLAISEANDDPEIRTKYRPFLLDPEVEAADWISQLELETAITMAEENLAKTQSRLKVLVLYGSLRKRYESFHYNSLPEHLILIRISKLLFQANGLRSLPHPSPSRLRRPYFQPDRAPYP